MTLMLSIMIAGLGWTLEIARREVVINKTFSLHTIPFNFFFQTSIASTALNNFITLGLGIAFNTYIHYYIALLDTLLDTKDTTPDDPCQPVQRLHSN